MAGSWSNTAVSLIVLIEQVTGYSGIFGYSPTIGAGNLVFSLAAAAGTDPYGNAYPKGLSVGFATLPQVQLLPSALGAILAEPTNRALELTPAELIARAIGISGSPTESLRLDLRGPTASTAPDGVDLKLDSQRRDGGSLATASITHTAAGTLQSWDNLDTTVTVPLVYTATLLAGAVDMGAGVRAQVSSTANVSGITTGETVLMQIPSMTYTNARAYRVTVWGLAQSTTAPTYFLYRLRKGTATTTGTIYKDQIRVPTINVVSTNSAVNFTVDLVNVSGSDITTDVTLTGSCAAGTGIFAASANNVATITVEDVGLASQWPGQPIT